MQPHSLPTNLTYPVPNSIEFSPDDPVDNISFFQKVMDHTSDLVYLIDLQHQKIIYANEKLQGLLAGAHLGLEAFEDILHPGDFKEGWRANQNLQNGDAFERKGRVKEADGRWHWYCFREVLFSKNKDQEGLRIMGIATNIQETMTARSKLKDRQALIQSLFDSASNGITISRPVKDEEGRVIDFECVLANRQAEKITGRTLEKQKFNTLFPHSESSGLFSKFKKTATTGIPFRETIYYPHDGLNHWLHICAVKQGEILITNFTDITEKKQVEEELEWRQQNYQTLAEHSPDVITRWDKNLKLIYANQGLEGKTGKPVEELLGKDFLEMGTPAEIAKPYMRRLQDVVESKEGKNHLNYFNTPYGRAFFHSRMVPEFDTKGEVVTILSIARDITQIKEANQKIKSDAHFIQHIADRSPYLIMVTTVPDNDIVYVNHTWENFYGYSRKDTSIPNWEELMEILIHPEDSVFSKNFFRQILRENGPDSSEITYRILSKGGRYRWMHHYFSVFKRNGKGQPIQILSWALDKTEQYIAEQKLKEKEHFLRQIIEASPDILVLIDVVNDRVPYVNTELYSIIGYPTLEIEKMTLSELNNLIHPKDRKSVSDFVAGLSKATDEEVWEVKFRLRDPNDDWKYFHSRGKVFERDETGRAKQHVILSREINHTS